MEGRRFLSAFMLLTLLFMSMAATQGKPASAAETTVPSPSDEEDNIPWSAAGEDFLPLAAGRQPAAPKSPPAVPAADDPSPPEQDPPPTPTPPTGPRRRCKRRSNRYRGLCTSRSNCARICKTEGYTGGYCGGYIIPACWCTRPCFFEEELPLSPTQPQPNPSIIDNSME
ncbi:hypothetical protein Dimus_012358 [Dionaea muscipula]